MYFLGVENDYSALVMLFALQLNLISFTAKRGFVMSLKFFLSVTIVYYQYFPANKTVV